MAGSILIIDDDRDVLDALRVLLEDEFDYITTDTNATRLPSLLGKSYDVVLLDMNFSAGRNVGNEGLYWLSQVLALRPEMYVVMMTAYGNIDLAVEAIKRGASDFVLKPWDNEKMISTLRAGVQKKKKSPALVSTSDFQRGTSAVMLELQEQIERVADTDASILVLGENGTGKEVIAREIHRRSRRQHRPFFQIDLSSIPEHLFESELFGYKKGSFTDARIDKPGKILEASGGTLFLDEIGNMPLSQQAKLLTALQSRVITPVGSNENVAFDVRLICATNANLEEMVSFGKFRQDLFYRINTVTITVPPLRAREQDIILLAESFLKKFVAHYNKQGMQFSSDAKDLLLTYHWPGNVRELEHTIEKAVILSKTPTIETPDLGLSISAVSAQPDMLRTLEEVERDALVKALATHAGNIVHAARALGITRQTLYNKMKKYGL